MSKLSIEDQTQINVQIPDVPIGEVFRYGGAVFLRTPTIDLVHIETDEGPVVLRNVVAVNVETGFFLSLHKSGTEEDLKAIAISDAKLVISNQA